MFYRTSRPFTEQEGDYRLITPGAIIRFGVPFSETDTVFFGAGIERTEIDTSQGTNGLPLAYKEFTDQFGSTTTSIPLTVGWSRDTRDSSLVPTRGRFQRVNGEFGIGGDTRYLKASYQIQEYIPLNNRFTLAFNAEAGYGRGFGGRPFPLFKNFFGGGLGSVRGFEQGTLGRTSPVLDLAGNPTSTIANIGGTRSVLLNTEIIAPFPGAGNDRTLRMFGFFDVGNVYGEGQRFSASDLRASVGIGVSWISPVGPLRIAYARPVREQVGDKTQSIQFQIGTSF